MKLFVVFGFLCLGAVLASPTGETSEKLETEAVDTQATSLLTEESDALTHERHERSYGYQPEHKGHGHGHGYGHHEHKGHGYGHHEHKSHGYGHHEHKGYGHEHKKHEGHGYGHGHEHKGYGHHEHKGHGYGHHHEHKSHGYGHQEHKGYGHEHKKHEGHGYGHGHSHGHGHGGHGYKSNFEAAEQFDAQADFVASSHYGHAAPAYGHHGDHHGHHYVQPVHHQTHSYGAHAPKVHCGSNLLVGCNVHTAKVPCVPHHGGYGHAAPAYHAPKYEHKPAAHGYKFGADEEPKEQPKEDKQ